MIILFFYIHIYAFGDILIRSELQKCFDVSFNKYIQILVHKVMDLEYYQCGHSVQQVILYITRTGNTTIVLI